MAHFFGSVQGAKGEATRLGGRSTGLSVTAASWQGAVMVDMKSIDGIDHVTVKLVPWKGAGIYRVLYGGPVSGCMTGECVY